MNFTLIIYWCQVLDENEAHIERQLVNFDIFGVAISVTIFMRNFTQP